MALVAVIAAVGFSLVAPTASAAPPPPNPTSDSSGRKPGFWNKLQGQWNKWQWQMYESWVEAALDPHDRYYKWKLARLIAVKRVFKKMEGDDASFSIDVPKLAEDAAEFRRRSQETPDGLRRQLTETGNKLHDLKQKVNQARTPAEREAAVKNQAAVRKWYKYLAGKAAKDQRDRARCEKRRGEGPGPRHEDQRPQEQDQHPGGRDEEVPS